MSFWSLWKLSVQECPSVKVSWKSSFSYIEGNERTCRWNSSPNRLVCTPKSGVSAYTGWGIAPLFSELTSTCISEHAADSSWWQCCWLATGTTLLLSRAFSLASASFTRLLSWLPSSIHRVKPRAELGTLKRKRAWAAVTEFSDLELFVIDVSDGHRCVCLTERLSPLLRQQQLRAGWAVSCLHLGYLWFALGKSYLPFFCFCLPAT